MDTILNYLQTTVFYNISLLNWGISLIILLFTFLFIKALLWIFFKIIEFISRKTKINLTDSLLASIRKPISTMIAITGVCWAFLRLHFDPKFDIFLRNAYHVVIILCITWIVAQIVHGIIRKVLATHHERTGGMDDNVVRMLSRAISGVIWALGIVVALGNVGINVGGILAGLGIGGVAFALAAQDTIKNIFAGIVIFIDKPFRLGDLVTIESNTGRIEDIGLRSVRIRTLDKQLIIISSSKAVDSVIENISEEPARRITLSLGLTYDTTPEKMSLALKLLRDLPSTIPAISDSTPYFTDYGDSALKITYNYAIKKSEDIMEVQSQVNLAILSSFNKHKLDFAFPTQTVYVQKVGD